MFTLKIKTDNAAFAGRCNETYEVARILRDLADRVETNGCDIYISHDSNGNQVGSARFTKRQP